MADSETSPEVEDGASVPLDADGVARGMKEERERAVAYLKHHAKRSSDMAEKAETEESRVYQTTISNAMTAMARALGGSFHWQDFDKSE